MLDECTRRGGIAVVQTREQRSGLLSKVIEMGAGGKVCSHGSSMHRPGPHAGCIKEIAFDRDE